MRTIGAVGRKFCRRFASLFKYLSRKVAQGTEFLFVRRAGARMAEKRIFKRDLDETLGLRNRKEKISKSKRTEKQREESGCGNFPSLMWLTFVRCRECVFIFYDEKAAGWKFTGKRSLRRGARVYYYFFFFLFFRSHSTVYLTATTN